MDRHGEDQECAKCASFGPFDTPTTTKAEQNICAEIWWNNQETCPRPSHVLPSTDSLGPGSASNTGARRARKDRNINCPGHKIYNYLINRKDKQQGRERRGGHSIHVRCQLEWPHCRCGEGKGCQIRVGASE